MPMIRQEGPGRKIINGIIDSRLSTRVGYFPSARYADGTPVAYIAAIQELGCPERSIPSRSFMRSTADERRVAWIKVAADGFEAVANGDAELKDVFEGIGLQASSDIKKTISTLTEPPLSKITMMARKYVAANGGAAKLSGTLIGEFARELKENPDQDFTGISDKPLIDPRMGGGVLLATLTYEVKKINEE